VLDNDPPYMSIFATNTNKKIKAIFKRLQQTLVITTTLNLPSDLIRDPK
jgi:hypothetical protein